MTKEKKSFKKIAKARTIKTANRKTSVPRAQIKKAVKKVMSENKLFAKTRVKKLELTLDSLTQLIKEGSTLHAIEQLLTSIKSPDDIVSCFVTFINKSKFRAYSMALKRFNFVIHEYNKTNNRELLTSYLKNLENEMGKEAFYSEFTDLRIDIVKYLSGIPVSLISTAKNMTFVLSSEASWEEQEKELSINQIDFICLLADKLWPGKTKGLRLLYGRT